VTAYSITKAWDSDSTLRAAGSDSLLNYHYIISDTINCSPPTCLDIVQKKQNLYANYGTLILAALFEKVSKEQIMSQPDLTRQVSGNLSSQIILK
jgi:hypothetical protein